MNRAEALERIAPLMEMKVREVEHTPRTRVMVTPEAILLRPAERGRFLPMTAEGARSMASHAGFPQELAKQLSPGTFARVATELLARKGKYSLLLKQDMVIGFAKARQYRVINPERALRSVEQGLGNADYHRVLVEGQAVSLEILGEQQTPVVRGDMVRGGAMVTFSPLGIVQPTVKSYVMRLVCTNGATGTDVLREYQYGGEGDDIWQWFRQSARDAYRSLERVVNRWRQMREEQIPPEDRALVLEAMLKEAGIGKAAADAVRAQALATPPQTAYDVMNLVTWASSHLLERPKEIRRAQNAAASFSEQTEHRRICPVCHRQR